MASKDSAAAADRIAPGAPGSSIKFTFTSTASTFQPLRTKSSNETSPPVYVSIKVTADCHICFGAPAVGAPTNADMLFQAADGWQDMLLTADMTGFRIKGDAGGGDIYVWRSGL